MTEKRTVQIKVPCSTSNLGSGFDTVSAALGLYLTLRVTVERGNRRKWTFCGEIPPDNIIDRALQSALQYLEVEPVALHIEVDNPIPLKRGLGSSGAAIIGGIKLAEWLSGKALDDSQILNLAFPLEGHPDNVAASLLGGWVISRVDSDRIAAERLKSALEARFVVCVPEVEVSTAEARKILPSGYSLEDVAYNLQRIALLVYALEAGRGELLKEATQDRIHQPYRARLVPGADRVLSLKGIPPELERCVLSITISGSGSTMLALVDGQEDAVGKWMVGNFRCEGIQSRYMVLQPDRQGARMLG